MIELTPVPVKFKMSVMQVGKSFRVTIPKELCEHLHLSKGDKVAMWADNTHVIMEKNQEVPP